jgi:hypothetical protein
MYDVVSSYMTRRKIAGSKTRVVKSKRKAAGTTKTAVAVSSSRIVKKQKWPFIAVDGPVAFALIHVDALLEKISKKKLKSYDESNVTQLRKLDVKQIKELSDHYKLTATTMKLASSGDEFYIEAYSNFTKPQLKLALEYLKQIKSLQPDLEARGKIRLGSQTPRAKKQKPPSQLVQKALYLTADEETGVTSLHPQELLGASELWVYNVKTRKLGCYYATDDQGLSIKGTTILNYDEKRSTTKTIRKPKTQVYEFTQGGIKWMRGYWGSIRSTPQAISPRLSRDTLILKAHR